MFYQKNLSSKLNYLTKYHSCRKKNLSLPKCLTQKMYSLKNTHNHKKEPCGILQKNSKKKFPKKNFKKKIEERLPRFSRSQIGEGGYGLIHLRNGRYALIHLHRQKNRHIDRHRDMKQREGKGKIHPICLFVWVVWSLLAVGWLFRLVRFTLVRLFRLVRFGSDFLTSHKKIF